MEKLAQHAKTIASGYQIYALADHTNKRVQAALSCVRNSPNLAAHQWRAPVSSHRGWYLIWCGAHWEKRLPPNILGGERESSGARSAKALYTNLTLCQHTRERANKMQKRTEERERCRSRPAVRPRGKIDYWLPSHPPTATTHSRDARAVLMTTERGRESRKNPGGFAAFNEFSPTEWKIVHSCHCVCSGGKKCLELMHRGL